MNLKEINEGIVYIASTDVPIKVSLQMYGLVTCPKEWGFTETPIFHRVYYIYDGKAKCEIEGHSFELKKDHLYFFPANRQYTLSHDYNYPLKCLYLHLYIYPNIENSMFGINIGEQQSMTYIIRLLERICDFEESKSRNMILNQAVSLLYFVDMEHALEVMDNEHIKKILRYIEEEYMHKITNEILANYLGFNTNYFIKIFSKAMGLSPQVYLAKYRLNKAIKLLMNGYPVNEVAHLIGYDDAKAFCRFFKKFTGVPPSYYKKYYKEKI